MYGRTTKLFEWIDFPPTLDVKELIEVKDKSNGNYELYGVIVHIGQSDSGHYYAYGQYNDIWYKFNDSHVTQTDINTVLAQQSYGHGQTPYMLFYQ